MQERGGEGSSGCTPSPPLPSRPLVTSVPHSLPDGRALAVTVTWRPSASVHMHSHGARLFFWNPAGMLGGRACLAQFPGQSFPRARIVSSAFLPALGSHSFG